ncbi:MAG: DUF1460 domain-containing protein [Prevotella sp.]|nr:DUF1460 domain-containing protein [Prevotella sp.]
MKHLLFFFLLFILAFPLRATEPEYTNTDSQLITRLLTEATRMPKSTNWTLHFAKKFLGRPYVAHTLDNNEYERLVVNTRQLDCTTFVETVVALSLCAKNGKTSFADYCAYLAKIRYAGGKVAYTHRNHYFSTWIEENTKNGVAREIQSINAPFTAIQTVTANFMSTHVSSYSMLNRHREWLSDIVRQERAITGKKYRFIPKSAVNSSQAMKSAVHDGDIIAIVTNKKGLEIAHLGIAVWKNDGLHMIDASSISKKVISETLTLSQYLQRHPSHLGIRVVRLK